LGTEVFCYTRVGLARTKRKRTGYNHNNDSFFGRAEKAVVWEHKSQIILKRIEKFLVPLGGGNNE
jgi:hypothetical protein